MSVKPVKSSPYRRVAVAVALILLCLALWYFSTIVVYIIISLFLALLGRPIQNLIGRVRIRSWKPGTSLTAAVTLILLFVFFGAVIYAITPAIISQFANISSYTGGEASDILRYPLKGLEDSINEFIPGMSFSFQQVILDQVEPLLSLEMVKNTVGHIAKMTTDLVVGIFCVSFITFFFLQDEKMFSKWVISLVPDEYVASTEKAMKSIYSLQVRYIVGITLESLIKFVVLFLLFWLFGLHADTSAVAAGICAVLNVIPYVGPVIGGVLALILGALSVPYGNNIGGLLLAMTSALLIFQLVDNILLQPIIYGSSVKAHPLEIFIVILMAGHIAGIVGMLLAIPTYTILRVLAKEFFSRFKVVRELTTNL